MGARPELAASQVISQEGQKMFSGFRLRFPEQHSVEGLRKSVLSRQLQSEAERADITIATEKVLSCQGVAG